MARITTSKGVATLRPMLAKDELILSDLGDLEEKGQASAFYRVKGRMLRALEAGAIEAEWDGGFGELPAREILTAFVSWNVATEEEAVPPDSGNSSETPSPAGD